MKNRTRSRQSTIAELLNVKGALGTIDAMGCQKELPPKCGKERRLSVHRERKPEHLYEGHLNTFVTAYDQDGIDSTMDVFTTEEKGHGREERRTYTILTNLGDFGIKEACRN